MATRWRTADTLTSVELSARPGVKVVPRAVLVAPTARLASRLVCRARSRRRPEHGVMPRACQTGGGAVGHGTRTKNTHAQIEASKSVSGPGICPGAQARR